ncbi:MAG: substrate-binding domain-containing protein [Candidatus Hydrogenedentes bacterium]|nr:substrate-binding domain-containing protein [Candidatus Hydrogenedentota bacterium]
MIATLIAGCGAPAGNAAAPADGAAPQEAAAPADGAAPAADKKLVIGLMPKLVGIEYFNATEKGARKAAAELGVELVYDGPQTADVTLQAQMVDTWVTKQIDAIAIAPNDPDAIAVALKKARKRGVKVLSWDADCQKDSRDFFVNQCTAESVAHTLVDVMARNAGENAKYLILTGTLTAANQNLWIDFMERYTREKYPNMVNLSETPKASEEDQALATQVTTDSLKAYPGLQGIYAITSVALPGAAEALRKANAQDRVFLTGLTVPSVMREHVSQGIVKEFVLWNPEDLGYLCIHAAVAAVKGELQPGDGTFKAGRLGEVTIKGDEVILGDPLIFTKDNIGQYNF